MAWETEPQAPNVPSVYQKLYYYTYQKDIKQEDAYCDLNIIHADVPQGSVLGPTIYLLYTRDVPTFEQNITFADYKAILTTRENNTDSTEKI